MKKTILYTLNEHKRLVDEFEQNGVDSVIAAAELITESYKNGGCVYICGNGGSADGAGTRGGFARAMRYLGACARRARVKVEVQPRTVPGVPHLEFRCEKGICDEADQEPPGRRKEGRG